MYEYNVHGIFSLTSNVPNFERMLHAFRATSLAQPSDFRFHLKGDLRIFTKGKERINVMFYRDPHDDSIELDYPWLVPIRATLAFQEKPPRYNFSFNRNYLRVSQIIGGGWRLLNTFRSLLQLYLIRKNMLMLHGAAIKIGDAGILIPAIENTGKTTTAWMLARRGAQFGTDEHVIVDRDGGCYCIPGSSSITRTTARAVNIPLSTREKISLLLNHLKGKLLTVHLTSGGIGVYPQRMFSLCSEMKLAKIAIIQNGPDFVREIPPDEAFAKIRTIQSIEFAWRTDPFIQARSFFDTNFNANALSSIEDNLLRSVIAKAQGLYLVSSSNGQHYREIEKLVRG